MSSKSPRRKRNNWTNEEVNLLKDCVLKYGRKWSLLEKNFPLFKKNNRTQIDLKDKWRNICRQEGIIYSKCSPGYIIFTKDGCDYCKKAKDLIKNYREINVTSTNINSIYSFIDKMTNKYRKFPIIFQSNDIKEKNIVDVLKKSKFIGGFSDLESKIKKIKY
jgi:glutaredoxin